MLGAVAVVGAVLTASIGCASQPDDAPIFASDEEALAAAEETLREYRSLNARYFAGENVEAELFALLTADAAELERASLIDWESRNQHLEGEPVLSAFTLKTAALQDPIEANVEVVYCVDISPTRIVDDAGVDVTPPRDSEILAIHAVLLVDANAPYNLLIDSQDPANGAACSS